VGGLLVLSVLLAQIVFSSVQPPSLSRLLGDGASQAPRVTSGHVAATPAVAAPAPTLTAAPTDVPTDVPSAPSDAPGDVPTGASGERLQVSGTDGQGVVLRASPHEDDKVPRGFMDGSWVTVLDRSGPDWALVLGDNGQQGWVPVHYLTR
jgi:hypothetical protein